MVGTGAGRGLAEQLPKEIENILLESFQPEIHKKKLGKILFVGRKID